jgi:2-polyprenyl-6-methoxyphenol hydroxylase-like FAD-dependent oxidoreductase
LTLRTQYGKKLESIFTADRIVMATFADGTSDWGNLLIGADGAHSVTRKCLFTSSPQDGALLQSPVFTSTTLSTFDPDIAVALRKLNTQFCLTFSPSGLYTWFSGKHLPNHVTFHELVRKNPLT